MAGRMTMAVGLPRPDGHAVQVYRGEDEICAVVPAAIIEAALGPAPHPDAARAWLLANGAAIAAAAAARADGLPAARPFDGLRILGKVSCR